MRIFFEASGDYPYPNVPVGSITESIEQHMNAFGFRNVRASTDLRVSAIADAAREFIDAYDIGHEEEHMFVDALRKALGGAK